MGLNLKALKGIQDDLNSRGSGLVVRTKALGEETDFRPSPPLPSMNGIYFIERIVFWIGNKPYISPATFGRPCPMDEELEAAKAYNDKDLNQLIASKNFKRQSEFWVPGLFLKCLFEEDGTLTECKVVDDKVKILSCGSSLMKAVNRVVTARTYQNGTEDGLMDRVKGFNVVLTKTGSGLDTEYSALGWNTPMEMDEKYYTEKAIPNVITLTEQKIKSDDHLRSVIRNYFYGEEIVPDANNVSDEEEGAEVKHVTPPPAKAAVPPTRTGSPAGAPVSARPQAGAPKVAAGRPVAQSPAARPTAGARPPAKPRGAAPEKTTDQPGTRNVLKDLTDLDD